MCSKSYKFHLHTAAVYELHYQLASRRLTHKIAWLPLCKTFILFGSSFRTLFMSTVKNKTPCSLRVEKDIRVKNKNNVRQYDSQNQL